MKRILLFLLLYYIFAFSMVSGLLAAPAEGPEKIVVHPLFNFDEIYVTLRSILIQIFLQYYQYLLGFIAVMLLLSYIQGVLEGRRMRAERKRRETVYLKDKRERAEIRRLDKFLERERELIRKYTHASDERIAGIQWEMRAEQEVKDNEQELRLSPYDQWDTSVRRSDVFCFSGKVAFQEYDVGLYRDRESYTYGGRGTTYFREDGMEESGGVYASKAVIDRNSNRNRFHRGMDGDDDYSGY